MRALELTAYDGLEALRVVERDVPEPGPGQVVVRVEAAPANPSDVEFVHGRYGFRRPLPTVPGFEGSGTVVAGVGEHAEALIGSRVAFVVLDGGSGTWAEHALTEAAVCIPLAPEVSSEQGATLVISPFTAWALVEVAQQGGHGAIVSTAAASALGRMLLRLAERVGLDVVHVVRRGEQVAELGALGARHVLSTDDPAFDADLTRLCHDLGATLAVDAVAGEMPGRLLRAMPQGSTVVVYGVLAGQSATVPVGELIYRGARVQGFWLTHHLAGLDVAGLTALAQQVQEVVATDLRTEVGSTVGLDGAVAAIREHQGRAGGSKVLLTPSTSSD